MAFPYSALWLLLAFFARLLLKDNKNTTSPDREEGEKETRGIDRVLSKIGRTWSPEALQEVLRFEEGAWEEEEAGALLRAYHRQHALLMGIAQGDARAKERAAGEIRRRLGERPSMQRKGAVRSVFAWVLEQQPDLERLFREGPGFDGFSDGEERGVPPRGYASPKEDLFAACTNRAEIKKRFRRLSMLNHPDRGGSEAAMKAILAQYEAALQRAGVR